MVKDIKIYIQEFNEIFGKDFHKSNPEAFILYMQTHTLNYQLNHIAEKIHGVAINMDEVITSWKQHNGID